MSINYEKLGPPQHLTGEAAAFAAKLEDQVAKAPRDIDFENAGKGNLEAHQLRERKDLGGTALRDIEVIEDRAVVKDVGAEDASTLLARLDEILPPDPLQVPGVSPVDQTPASAADPTHATTSSEAFVVAGTH